MSFIELRFFLFAALTVLLYYVLPKKAQWLVLLGASVVFYLTYGWQKIVFILAATGISWLAGKRMADIQQAESSPAAAKKRCKPVLLLAVGALVLLLVYAKIGAQVRDALARLLQWQRLASLEVLVALGISYYTFSLIAYLADIYWRKDKAEQNYLRLLLFGIYFPKVLQGPISRHKNLGPQLREEHAFDYRALCFGLQLMVWGYFKKMVIADRLALFVNTVFGNIAKETGAHLLVAMVFSVMVSYCDFSGCMDIVRGFSQCLGIELETNFERPFFAKSAAELWRRWHMTLGTWFKDYIYMPIMISPRLIRLSKSVRERCGARAGKAVMVVLPLMSVWLITGLWHGTTWNFVVWGLYWGALIVSSNVFTPEIKRITNALRINTQARSWKVFQMARTFLLLAVSHVLTVTGTVTATLRVAERLLFAFHPEGFFDGSLYKLGLDRPNFILAAVCLAVLLLVDYAQEKGVYLRERIAQSNVVFRWMIYYAAVFSIVIFGIYGPGYDAASFIYMQF